MKKNSIVIPVILLLILQAISLFRISRLESQISELTGQVAGIANNSSSLAGNIYSNVESLLKRQASIIDSYDFTFGEVDKNSFEVPVTFTVTPKVSSQNTVAKLVLSGEDFIMERSGTTYSATGSISIFDELKASVIFSESGADSTEKLGEFGMLMEKFIPSFSVRFDGSSGYRKNNDEASGTYERKGTIALELYNFGSAAIIEAALIAEVDGVVVSEDDFSDSKALQVDRKYELKAGQTLVMYVKAVDSLGLTHIIRTNEISIGADGNQSGEEIWDWDNNKTLLDKDGKVVFTYDDRYIPGAPNGPSKIN